MEDIPRKQLFTPPVRFVDTISEDGYGYNLDIDDPNFTTGICVHNMVDKTGRSDDIQVLAIISDEHKIMVALHELMHWCADKVLGIDPGGRVHDIIDREFTISSPVTKSQYINNLTNSGGA